MSRTMEERHELGQHAAHPRKTCSLCLAEHVDRQVREVAAGLGLSEQTVRNALASKFAGRRTEP